MTRVELFLDSASLEDARAAAALRFVVGITTNPTLLAREGRRAAEQIPALLDAFPGLVFHQPVSVDPREAADEIRALADRAEGRLVAKLPALPELFPVAAELASVGMACAVTAVYTPAQALVAASAGVRWIIPYVNRAARLREGGAGLVASLYETLAAADERPDILAASIKSVDEAVTAFWNGANAVSASLAILRAMGEDELTRSAVDAFTDDAREAGLD